VLINLTVDALISAHQFIIHGLSEYKESECLYGTGRPTAKRPPETLDPLLLMEPVITDGTRYYWTEPVITAPTGIKHTLATQCRG